MKKLYIFIFLMSAALTGYAQYYKIDSIKKLLRQENTDTSRIRKLIALGLTYRTLRNDSAMIYFQDALNLSVNIGFKIGEIRARHYLAFFLYTIKSDYATALDLYLKNLQVAEQANDTSFLVYDTKIYDIRDIGFIYERIKNFSKQLEYTIKLRDLINEEIYKDSAHIIQAKLILDNRLAAVYTNLNQLDSAKYHYLNNFNFGIQNNNIESMALSAQGIGNVYAKGYTRDSAVHYYHIAARAALKGNRQDIYNECLLSLGELYWKTQLIDSAFFYALNAFNTSQQRKDFDEMSGSAALLAKTYYAKNQIDSAYKYLNRSMQLKDSLLSEDKIAEIQNLSVKTSLKSQEEEQTKKQAITDYQSKIKMSGLLAGLIVLLGVSLLLLRNNKQKHKAARKIEKAYEELKSTQAQLIQSEKMASLGELTAGIAHEIQNPLNFVNNFSDLNTELVDELKEELKAGNIEDVEAIANDIKTNNEKISHHGKRAESIVTGMLQHSRTSTGQKEPTDINKLADEYLRLSYHGLRAKDNSFNATIKTDFDESIGAINIISQDIGRVILNLINNAFYACAERSRSAADEKKKTAANNYEPNVSISTKKLGDKIEIKVTDNGNGIPLKILDKIFQPFFTTKPTGQGTGLGLSLAYDIIKALGGEIKVETNEGEGLPAGQAGATFIIQLPV